jgi:hypothetical protein
VVKKVKVQIIPQQTGVEYFTEVQILKRNTHIRIPLFQAMIQSTHFLFKKNVMQQLKHSTCPFTDNTKVSFDEP